MQTRFQYIDGDLTIKVEVPNPIPLLKAIRTIAPGLELRHAKSIMDNVLRSVVITHKDARVCNMGETHMTEELYTLDAHNNTPDDEFRRVLLGFA